MVEHERAVALEAVREAVALCRAVSDVCRQDGGLDKADRSPVTVADFGVQALVLDCLARAFPGDGLVAEETAVELRRPEAAAVADRVLAAVRSVRPDWTLDAVCAAIDRGQDGGGGGRFWTLDPIDGTKGFLRGGQYAVALALIVDGAVELGILGCPNLQPSGGGAPGLLFEAVRGGGARMRPATGDGAAQPVQVSARRDPASLILCESVESGHTAQDWSAAVARRLGSAQSPVRVDSQCKYAIVARGEADAYLRLPTRPDYEERIWDHAAGWLVATESGGRVTDIEGRPLDFSRGRTLSDNRGVVVTNGWLHDVVLTAVAVGASHGV